MIDWIKDLEKECEKSSQRRVAKSIGYSATTINMVIKGCYTGDLSAVETAFKVAFKDLKVECPILGIIKASICNKQQKMGLVTCNPLKIKIYKACRNNCPNFKGEKK